MTPTPSVGPSNRLLAAIPVAEYERIRPSLDAVVLPVRAVLYEPGQALTHVYFPTAGVVSLLCPVAGSDFGIEVGLVGREGMAGLGVFLRTETTPMRGMVQVAGAALRMPAAEFRRHVNGDCQLHHLLLRYAHAFLTQVSQSVLCNVRHSLSQRLSRWLLMTHVRTGADQFPMTHAFLAAMLGVRRATVTEAARGLRLSGIIRYERGHLTVLDRDRLEASSCSCHRIVQDEFDRLPT